MAEQATFVPAIPQNFDFEGQVQVEQGAYNHSMQLALLNEGTPFEASTVEACLAFMFQIAEAEKAKMSVHAPDLGKGPFTVAKLRAFIAEKAPIVKLKKNRSSGKPYIGLYSSDPSTTGRRKNKAY